MLKINNNEYKVLSSEIKFANATNNNVKGYTILISLDIEFNNEKGYITFYVDFFNNMDFKNIENKRYEELPSDCDSKIKMIEILDTQNFIDFIDSIVKLEFGCIQNNRIKMSLDIEDEYIKLNYQGELNIS